MKNIQLVRYNIDNQISHNFLEANSFEYKYLMIMNMTFHDYIPKTLNISLLVNVNFLT